jgi:hypothetical protein
LNVVFAWLIISAIVAAVSFGLPAAIRHADYVNVNSYWEDWAKINGLLWGLLLAVFAIAGGLTWAIYQIWL